MSRGRYLYDRFLSRLRELPFDDALSHTEKVAEAFKIYRTVNDPPTVYYTEHEILEEIKDMYNTPIKWNEGTYLETLDIKKNQGSALCRGLFPNLREATQQGKKSFNEKFYTDFHLKNAISFSLKYKNNVTPTIVKDSLCIVDGNVPSNFLPMRVKLLIDTFCPFGGTYYDFSGGYGGRLLGSRTSKKNIKYYATEPNTETHKYLLRFDKFISKALGTKDSDIQCKGSEIRCWEETEFIDFAFSSPPYYSLEHYTDEETQCYIKYDSLYYWFEGYVKPTIENIFHYLKKGSYYAVNIADFRFRKKNVHYVDKWVELSKEAGFTFIKKIPLKIQVRCGNNSSKETSGGTKKEEGIYLFKKEL